MADKTLLDSIEEITDDELQKVRDKLAREFERRGISHSMKPTIGKSGVVSSLLADREEAPLD